MIAQIVLRPARKAGVEKNALRSVGGRVALLTLLGLSVFMVGCGDGRPDRLKVSGQVLVDGKPLSHGYVRFVPKNARPSVSDLDENGRFTLTCFGNEDGVIPGTHQVEVNGAEYISNDEILWHAPKKYASFRASPLSQKISESTEALVINLSWEGGKPFKEKTR